MFKLNEIKQLIEWIDESSLQELEIENDGSRLRLRKPNLEPQAVHAIPQPSHAVQVSAPVQNVSTGQQAKEAESGPSSVAEGEEGLHQITSPMVGTFYESPSPGAEPFVKVGSQVKENTVVCIVEAMKLMNELEAEMQGEIVQVMAENGQLVEFGQPLFLVRPAK